jgi:uncharacterized membrane protein YtjA (UPF0391 family)
MVPTGPVRLRVKKAMMQMLLAMLRMSCRSPLSPRCLQYRNRPAIAVPARPCAARQAAFHVKTGLAPNPGPLRANYMDTCSPTVPEENIMLKWALIFAVIAVIAGLLGFTGIAAGAAVIAKFLFVLFLILCVVFLVLGFVVTKKIVD